MTTLEEHLNKSVSYGPDTSGFTIQALHDLIRKRAYARFETRGRRTGGELDDWLEAEQEVRRHFGL